MSKYQSKLQKQVANGISRRYRKERNFRLAGLGAMLVGLLFLGFFFYTLIGNGYTALWQTNVLLDIQFTESSIDPTGTREMEALGRANY